MTTTTTCLCQLGATHSPYTCLTVYAASAAPDCTHCSAPCTNVALSLGCDADSDVYVWVLRVLDVALGSCDPWCTSVVLYQALQHLLALTVPAECTTTSTTTTSCVGDTTVIPCTGPTCDETVLESATTKLFHLVQQPHHGHHGHGYGTAAPYYNQLALASFSLTPDAVRLLVDGCGVATSTLTVGACGDPTKAAVQSLRALYRLRQQLAVWLRRLDLALQVHQLDTNVFAYALAQVTDDSQWRAVKASRTSDSDVEKRRLEAGQTALVATRTDWDTLRLWYTQALTLVDAQCVTSTGTLVYNNTTETTTTSLNGTLCNTTTDTAWTTAITTTSPTDDAAVLQQVHALLDRAAMYVDQRSLARSWSSDAAANTPALDRQLVSVSVRHVRLETHREMRRATEAFINNVYGTTVPTSVTVPTGSAAAFQQQARMLRTAVAQADGTRWADGGL